MYVTTSGIQCGSDVTLPSVKKINEKYMCYTTSGIQCGSDVTQVLKYIFNNEIWVNVKFEYDRHLLHLNMTMD